MYPLVAFRWYPDGEPLNGMENLKCRGKRKIQQAAAKRVVLLRLRWIVPLSSMGCKKMG
jgi:hypothetical protein